MSWLNCTRSEHQRLLSFSDMITSRQILVPLLEALDRFNDYEEVIRTTLPILHDLQFNVNRDIPSNQFLYLKRTLQDTDYSGPGYRFIGLTHKEAVSLGIYDSESDAKVQKRPNISTLIKYFKNYKRGHYQSWAKTRLGIELEMPKQEFSHLIRGQGNFYIFKANISGIDLSKAADYIRSIIEYDEMENEEETQITLPDFMSMDDVERIFNDFDTSEEVLAPMPASVEFYNVYDVDELKR